ncbi:uncharacterized protein LOC113511779 isoform X2 [Galleria mellonella]|uniref:Odorant receptor n=1 Tax=Galleria mellonella TaxID=7137 RepID=A0ABM3MN35_GALME|nr:uncharacterized protein LOC113511779 isoform X2 [Galleria mellonella]
MSTDINKQVKPFDSFQVLYDILSWTGYLKPKNASSRAKKYLNTFHWLLTICIITYVNAGHIIFIFTSNDKNAIFETMILEITQINAIFKFLSLQTSKLSKINDVISGPYFATKSEKDEKLLKDNNKEMFRITTVMYTTLTTGCVVWIISYIRKKLKDDDTAVLFYVPIDSKPMSGFVITVFVEAILTLYVAYGHVAFDCVVAMYYAQAMVQLRIMKYNIQHMFDGDEVEESTTGHQVIYKDDKDATLKERFAYYVDKYDKVNWFTKNVNSVFNIALSFQFISMTGSCCCVICVLSISQSICSAMYLSNWVSVSPKFRRNIFIAMTRWTYPLKTRVSVVVPLSLSTMISIVRASYTLFTVMSEINVKE